MVYVLIESLILCVLFHFVLYLATKKDKKAMLHNLPIKIQERVKKQGDNRRILSTKERIIKKIPALIIVFILFGSIVYLNGARSFFDGCVYSFLIWIIIKLYVVFIIDILWYSNNKKIWIEGTEDLECEYKNYKFYLSSMPRSLIAGLMVSVIIGIVIEFI